tara:strand:- start:500 stop:715 length:216 start_codon:yes stop_codon:yes gene_type:complete
LSCGKSPSNNSRTLERHHELCYNWFNSEQTEEDVAAPFTYLGLDGKLEWGRTFANEVDKYCKTLKGSTEEY